MCVQEDERLRHENQKVTHVKGKDLDRQSCPIVNVWEQGASKVLW